MRFRFPIITTSALVLWLASTPCSFGDIYVHNVAPQCVSISQNPNSTSPPAESVNAIISGAISNDLNITPIRMGKWLTSNYSPEGATPYAILSYDTPQQVVSYKWVTGNDMPDSRQPTAWTLFGSNDSGTTWVELDKQSGLAQLAVNASTNIYTLASNDSYSQYKFQVDAITNNNQLLFQMSELELYTPVEGYNVLRQDPISGTSTFTVSTNYEGHKDDTGKDETISKAFDNNTATKYCIDHPASETDPNLTTIKMNLTADITGYAISSANDCLNRSPRNWSFEGSNDGTNWTVLDTQSNIGFYSFYETKAFSLDTSANFAQYRLNITEENNGFLPSEAGQGGANSEAVIQFSEIQLLSNSPTNTYINRTNMNGVTVTASSPEGFFSDAENESKAIDNQTGTKWGVQNSTPTLNLTCSEPITATAYSLTTVNENNWVGRNPCSWELYGIAGDGQKVLLDSRSNVNFGDADSFQNKSQLFQFYNTTPYNSYQLKITQNSDALKGQSTVSFQIAEFNLYERGNDLLQASNLMSSSKMVADGLAEVRSTYTGVYGGAEQQENFDALFDSDYTTKMCIQQNISADNTYDIIMDYAPGLKFALDSYSIATANDVPERNPSSWTLSGSNDGGETWTTLDEITNYAFPGLTFTDYMFEVDNDEMFSSYKLSFSETLNPNHEHFQISEVSFNSQVPEPSTWAMLILGLAGLGIYRRRQK